MSNAVDKIQRGIWNLVNRQGKGFYGSFLQNMKKIETNKVPTAGVNITDQINLYYNPDFFETLDKQQVMDVLEHEVKHVIHMHMLRTKSIGNVNHQNWNLACDAAINEELKSLHEMGITQDKLAEILEDPDLKRGETAEYYYGKIQKFAKENPEKCEKSFQPGSGNETIDDHGEWGQGDGNGEEGEGEGEGAQASDELAKNMVEKAMKKAVEESKGRGNTPWEVLTALERLGKSTVSWKQELRKFAAKADKFYKELSRKKRNRRYGLIYAGKRKRPNLHLAVALDESGSVGNDEFVQFFTEIDRLVDFDVKVTMIHADCQVNKVYEYEKGMKIERTGMGGTYYKPALDKAGELGVDGLIYFGDMDVWNEEVSKPKYPVLWAIVRGGERPFEFGSTCHVKTEKDNERY